MVVLSREFGTEKVILTYRVDEKFDGMRLDQFVQEYLVSHSRQAVKKKIKDKEVIIEGRPGSHKSSTKVYYKDIITVTINKTSHEDEYWRGELLDLQLEPEVIFEDDDLIAISKPPFMTTHPTGKHLFNCATVFFEAKYKKTIHSIHRLDRETSGVLLLGKNPSTSNKLTEAFEHDLVRKSYFFIAKKNSDYHQKVHFEANERLAQTDSGPKRVVIKHFPENSNDGKHARTFFHILHEEGDYVLGLAFPQTGRQHQIRVHAMVNGLPLVGDKIYLGGYEMFQRFKDQYATEEEFDLMELPRQALHAVAINIPYQNQRRIFKAPLPHDLKDWIAEKVTLPFNELQNKIDIGIADYFSKSELK